MKHFFGPILLKLSGNVNNGKNGMPLFCFSFEINTNEDICTKQFVSFFNSAHFSWFNVDHIFTVHSLEHGKCRLVGISKLSFMDLELLQAFMF